MVPCSSINCAAIFTGTYPQALNAGWQSDGQRTLCPKCAADKVNKPKTDLVAVAAEHGYEIAAHWRDRAEAAERRVAELEQDNARLQSRLDNYSCGPDD